MSDPTVNKLCAKCVHDCKQTANVTVSACQKYETVAIGSKMAKDKPKKATSTKKATSKTKAKKKKG